MHAWSGSHPWYCWDDWVRLLQNRRCRQAELLHAAKACWCAHTWAGQLGVGAAPSGPVRYRTGVVLSCGQSCSLVGTTPLGKCKIDPDAIGTTCTSLEGLSSTASLSFARLNSGHSDAQPSQQLKLATSPYKHTLTLDSFGLPLHAVGKEDARQACFVGRAGSLSGASSSSKR